MRRPHPTDGIELLEATMHHGVAVVEARLHTETRWQCSTCKHGFRKTGKHFGTYHTCKNCQSSFWLRAP